MSDAMPPITSPVLITGGSGYIGSRLIDHLEASGAHIRVLSRRQPDNRAIHWIEGHPAADNGQLAVAVDGVKTIFHLAGQTSVAAAAQDPDRDREANVTGLERIIESLERAADPPTLIFAGTVTQAGIPAVDRLDESSPDAPITVYDRHKLEAEQHLAAASARGVVLGVTLRLANVYGPGARAGAHDRGVLNQMIRAAWEGRPLTIHGDGSQLRDYTFIDDVVAAFLKAAGRAADICGRHFVIGSGQRHTIAQIVSTVAGRAAARHGRTIPVEHVPLPPTASPIDARSYVVDARAFSAATAWRPSVDLETGIDLTLDWLGDTR